MDCLLHLGQGFKPPQLQCACSQDDSARQHALSNFSSKKLRSGVNRNKADKSTKDDTEQGATGNSASPVGPSEDNLARDEANFPVTLNGDKEIAMVSQRVAAEQENNLDSSMGIGPVSFKSLASSTSAAASEAAPVSGKTLSGNALSGRSFGSSGRVQIAKSDITSLAPFADVQDPPQPGDIASSCPRF